MQDIQANSQTAINAAVARFGGLLAPEAADPRPVAANAPSAQNRPLPGIDAPEPWGDCLEKAGFRAAIAGADFPRVVRAAEDLEAGKIRALLFTGRAGCGKSFAARIIARRVFRRDPSNRHLDALDVSCYAVRALDESLLYCFRLARTGDILLDDLGTDTPLVDFGTVSDPVSEFISNFCDRPRRARCIVTTNLDSAGIRARYGERILSRLDEHFAVLHFNGGDHRAALRREY